MSGPVSVITIDETLDASGGANDSASDEANLRDVYASNNLRGGSGAFQYEIGGATTDVDVHLEAKLADDMTYHDWIPADSALSNGDSDLSGIDLEDLVDVRVRIVNQDGANQADVRAEVTIE